jgi:hypothetical protein
MLNIAIFLIADPLFKRRAPAKTARYRELRERRLLDRGRLRQRLPGSGIGDGHGYRLFLFRRLLGSFRWSILRFRFLPSDRFFIPPFIPVLELLKAVEGSGDLTVEGYFVAKQEFVGANARVAGAKCHNRT